MTDPLIALLCTGLLVCAILWTGLDIAKAVLTAAKEQPVRITIVKVTPVSDDGFAADDDDADEGEEWKGGLN